MSTARGPQTSLGLPRAALLLLVVTGVMFSRAVFSSDAFSARDVQRSYYPLKMVWAERVSQGEWPQWFAYDGMGQPYISALVSAALHPLNLLYLLFSVDNGLKWGLLLSYFAAAFGVHALARRLGLSSASAFTAGCTYAFSGYLISLSNNPHYVASAAALPYVFWAGHVFLFEGRAAALLGTAVSLALVVLAGDPQNFVVAAALLAAMTLFAPVEQRVTALRRCAWALAAGAALAAVQIIPTLAVRGHIAAQSYSLSSALSWSAHPLRLLEMFAGSLWLDSSGQRMLPGIATAFDTVHDAAWVDSQHLSPLVWVLALTALGVAAFRSRFGWLAGVWLLLCVLWLGRHLPVAGWFHSLPLWSSFRYPEKLTPWLLLGLALAAAAGLEQVARSEATRRVAVRISGGLALLLTVVAGGEIGTGGFSQAVGRWASLDAPALGQLHANVVSRFAVSAGVCWVLAGILHLSTSRPALLRWVRVLVVMHVVLQGTGLYWLTPVETLNAKPELLQHVTATDGVRPRVLSRVGTAQVPDALGTVSLPAFMAFTTAESLRPLTPARWGVESLGSYLPAAHRALEKSEEELQAFAPLWGTEYVVARDGQEVSAAREVAASPELKLKLWKFEHARPRAYLSLAAATTGPLTGAQAMELSQRSPPRSRIEPPVAPSDEPPAGEAALGTVTWRRYAPERVELEVTATVDSYLVLNDAAHPGWEATVDEASIPLLVANDVARAVAVSKGSHQVVMTYSTPGLSLGLKLSLAALLGLLGFIAFERARAQQAARP